LGLGKVRQVEFGVGGDPVVLADPVVSERDWDDCTVFVVARRARRNG
jgi:hypothetical protein